MRFYLRIRCADKNAYLIQVLIPYSGIQYLYLIPLKVLIEPLCNPYSAFVKNIWVDYIFKIQ